MRLINLTCPNCGARLQIDPDRKQVYCEHCGTKLLVDDNVHHIQYDNAEEAGYKFEKGRQRAMAESRMPGSQAMPYQQPQQFRYAQQNPPKKRRTWLWVLGWIFIFPIPLTILMLRKKDMKPAIKYGIIAAAWIIYLAIGASGNSKDTNTAKKEETPVVEETEKDVTPEIEENEKETAPEVEENEKEAAPEVEEIKSDNNDTDADKQAVEDNTDDELLTDDNADNDGGASASMGLKPIEIVDSGYTITGDSGDYYIRYGIILYNPNPDYYHEFPSFRIIAEDESGNVLDTEEEVMQYLNGNRVSGYAGSACDLKEKPANVTFEIIDDPDFWVKGTSGDLGLNAASLTKTIDGGSGTIAGKINNPTENTYDSVSVTVIFRDSDGNILGGDTTYIDNVKAKGSTAFSMDLLSKKYMSDQYELYFHNHGNNTYDTVIEGTDVTFVNTDGFHGKNQ